MKLFRHLITIVSILVGPVANAADEPPTSLQPPAFILSIACFSDTMATRPEWLFVVGGTAYRSLDALKAGITHFPKGSTLTWAPSCVRIGGEPLSSEAELKDFEAHCKSHGIRFILIPSG